MTVTDTFDRADNPASLGIADSGGAWVPRPWLPHDETGAGGFGAPVAQDTSILGISGGHAYSAGRADRGHLATLDHGSTDVDVVLGLTLPFPTGTGAGMIVRWASPTQFFEIFAYRSSGSSSHYYLGLRRVDGPASWVDLITSYGDGLLALNGTGGAHDFGIHVDGSEWAFSWDGELRGGFTDDTYRGATDHGLLQYFTNTPIIDTYNGEQVRQRWSVGAVAIA